MLANAKRFLAYFINSCKWHNEFLQGCRSFHRQTERTRRGGERLEERELIEGAKNGNDECWTELIRRYERLVHSVCTRAVGSGDATDDLAQDTFLRAIRALPEFHGQSSFSTWLYQIAMRRCLDHRRWVARHGNTVDVETLPLCGAEDDPLQPGVELMEREQESSVRRWVEALQHPYRRVVQMYYFERCTYQQIAERTGVTEKTVESQLYRARKLLREEAMRDELR